MRGILTKARKSCLDGATKLAVNGRTVKLNIEAFVDAAVNAGLLDEAPMDFTETV